MALDFLIQCIHFEKKAPSQLRPRMDGTSPAAKGGTFLALKRGTFLALKGLCKVQP